MRHETWMKLDSMPGWRRFYSSYRQLPDPVRAPVRWLLSPQWTIASGMVRYASRNTVVAGPFKGMTLKLSPISSRNLLGYILGSQEIEVRNAVEEIVARRYETILNVGAADGYYAVGLAKRSPQSHIVAFEALPELHPVIKEALVGNNIARNVEVAGKCEPVDFQKRLTESNGKPLVFMDIEGGEVGLLDPAATPALAVADIFVETHDSYVTGCTDLLKSRFAATHTIDEYVARPRTIADYPTNFLPTLPKMFPSLAVALMDERREGVQKWLYLKSKAA